jgi:signal transduction histidine kinase
MNKSNFRNKIGNLINRMRRSFHLRILLIVIVSGLIPSIVISFGIVESYESRATTIQTEEVQAQMRVLSNHLVKYNYLADVSSEVINAELDQLSSLYDGRVMIINKELKIIKDTHGINQGKTIVAPEVLKCFNGQETKYYDGDNNYIEIAMPITEKIYAESGEEVTLTHGVLLLSASTENIAKNMNILHRNAYMLGIIIMIALIGIDLALVRAIIRPFNKINDSIVKVEEGAVDEISDVPDYAETSQIVTTFNKILGKSKTLDDSRKEFVSNVSHELKTPLTSMKVLADSLLSQENVPNEIYQEFMKDIADEIDRENNIINDLLEMVRIDSKEHGLHIESTSINDCISRIAKQLLPIARKSSVELVFESTCQVAADVDEVKFSLAISNIVENAIKYNRKHGSVHIKLDADHQFFTVEVADSGQGIPEENIEDIFDKFYRVDKSHSREIGGTGLGLSIAKNIVLLHKGSIRVKSKLDEGSKFIIKIPLFYISD